MESLARSHDRSHFACGEPVLDEYLARFARQNHESGIAKTFVAVPGDKPRQVLGYYSISAGAIDRDNLPTHAAKRFPSFPIPVARLARLAVDREFQGRGLGEDLLLDVLSRVRRASGDIGIVAVLLDAKHDKAKRFYARYEFESLPDRPLTLWLPMTAIANLFPET
ncbi:MAG: GNAT family N-acetyltransferase [Candidatus Binataceae bacterium]|nr:GNAT family N-acetyltransferase [Candidatus Binataceae bacterium]